MPPLIALSTAASVSLRATTNATAATKKASPTAAATIAHQKAQSSLVQDTLVVLVAESKLRCSYLLNVTRIGCRDTFEFWAGFDGRAM
jgi:hypothetical protein